METVKVASASTFVRPLEEKAPSFSAHASFRSPKIGKCPTPWQILHIFRRILGLGAAIFFVCATIMSGVFGLRTLFGALQYDDDYGVYLAGIIPHYVGEKTIKESILFTRVLGGDSTPRQDTLYLESIDNFSHTKCMNVTDGVIQWLYSNEYLRSNWRDLITQTSYNLTYLRDSELIAPVVDCSFSAITLGDITSARVFYFMRKKADPSAVFLIVSSISTQDYEVPDQYQVGVAAYATLTVIDDMRMTGLQHSLVLALGYPLEGPFYSVYTLEGVTDDCLLVLRNVPKHVSTEYKRRVYTANRSGFYIKSQESQSNIKNMRWVLYDDPLLALTTWRWVGCTKIQNAWGWIRCVHFLFAADTIFNLCVLFLVSYRNYQRRKIWAGDAFVSISGSLTLRGGIVLVLWAMENFWQQTSLTLRDGAKLAGNVEIFSFAQIMHGDLMTLYVALAGLWIGFQNRLSIAEWLAAVKDRIMGYAIDDYLGGIADIPPELNGYAPFGYFTIHELLRSAVASLTALAPIFLTFIIIIVYAVIRKAYRRAYPSKALSYSSRITKGSSNLSEGKAIKSPFTMFELATGAELQNKVGLVSDYDNCIYIKGIRYASADGIYCNGFVIANNQWLIKTSDLSSVLLIILTSRRLRDVFVYEVKNHKVSQTARLVYPNTLTLMDLTKLNTTLLA